VLLRLLVGREGGQLKQSNLHKIGTVLEQSSVKASPDKGDQEMRLRVTSAFCDVVKVDNLLVRVDGCTVPRLGVN
jgi:hypothetical protein